MDCSDGAKMLIDQMKEHPEEFRGYAGKFASLLDSAREALQGGHRNVWMSQRDATAVLAAAEEHLFEVWLAEDVLSRIMQPMEEAVAEKVYTVGRGIGKSGYNTASNTASTPINTSTAQYVEQAYQMEKEKYRMELEKQRQQDNEFAMRLTKPFKDFL
jgi:hypothetical protein